MSQLEKCVNDFMMEKKFTHDLLKANALGLLKTSLHLYTYIDM